MAATSRQANEPVNVTNCVPPPKKPWMYKNFVEDSDEEKQLVIISREELDPTPEKLRHWMASGYMKSAIRCVEAPDSSHYSWDGQKQVIPTWISEPGVDSTIMLGAFLGFIQEYGQAAIAEEALPLQCICHTQEWDGIPVQRGPSNPFLVEVPCTEPQCQNCRKGTGGYKFKWIAQEWLNAYIYQTQRKWGQNPDQPRWHINVATGKTSVPQGLDFARVWHTR